ncbi:MAG: hypothetical protein INR69_16790 [Mucilaginibacter polytrichastri]|nr:hypothetical protein [Mucilaginibacter polytrichastri]
MEEYPLSQYTALIILVLVAIVGYVVIWWKLDTGERRNPDDYRFRHRAENHAQETGA